MDIRNHKKLTAAALFVIFAVTQVYIGVSFAGPNGGSAPTARPQQLMGILTTRDNQAVLVNGISTISGATIPSGATIETPDKVGATISVGALGTICIAPNTKLVIEFDQSGKQGSIKLTLITGCVILTTVKDVKGEIKTTQNALQISPATGGMIDVCQPTGEAPVVNKGAAANAGAGASGLGCFPPAGAAAAPTGISNWTKAAIFGGVGGAAICIIFCNPSPSTP